jgi:hypothetical protein
MYITEEVEFIIWVEREGYGDMYKLLICEEIVMEVIGRQLTVLIAIGIVTPPLMILYEEN